MTRAKESGIRWLMMHFQFPWFGVLVLLSVGHLPFAHIEAYIVKCRPNYNNRGSAVQSRCPRTCGIAWRSSTFEKGDLRLVVRLRFAIIWFYDITFSLISRCSSTPL
jgi:hypothetical protein